MSERRPPPSPNPYPSKRKRNLPGTPDPDAQVVALSPSTLLSATTFVCDICGKEFRRDQNLQIHRRGHHLSCKLPPRGSKETKKRVYICPVEGCVYHDPSRALGDLTGIKKHYCRKHGEKRWKCGTCHRKYAVKTDWNSHVRACGVEEYECACGTLFSRKDSYGIHKVSCGAMKGEARSMEMAGVDFGFGTVNAELLFPSLWGKVLASEDDEQRGSSSTQSV